MSVSGTGEETVVEHLNFVGTGSAPNFGVTASVHVTVNANGTVTVDRVDFTSC